MPFDSITTAAVAEDLDARLSGGRVDKIVQPGSLDVALLFWANGVNQWLVLSADAQQPRAQRTAVKQANLFPEPSSFVMLLRKYLEGARLQQARQQGVDRVLQLRFLGALGETTLIAEIMGKYSNIILADHEMMVLGAVKHVRPEENRVRVTLPHHPYLTPPRPVQPPPHQDRFKLDPLRAIGGELAIALADGDPAMPLWKALLDHVDGLSPTTAREATFLASGAVDTPLGGHDDLGTATRLLGLVRERFGTGRGQPSLVRQGEKVAEWAAFPLHYLGGDPRLFADIAALLEEVYAPRQQSDGLAGQRGPLVAAIEAQRKTLRRKVTSLESSLVPRERLDAMRTQGEMVMAYQHSIEAGQTELHVPELALTIPLDPALTALENAQRLFKRYGKSRDAAAVVPDLLEAARQELAYLDQLSTMAQIAGDPGSLAAVRGELREANADPAAPKKKPKGGDRHPGGKGGKGGKAQPGPSPLRVKAADGTELLVGRSAKQNEAVTFALSGPQDLWFHARQIPGAHVILRHGGRPPSEETIRQAAGLAAYYSQARTATTVPVDYAPVRNVRRIKGGKPGLVHYAGESTIVVRPSELAAR